MSQSNPWSDALAQEVTLLGSRAISQRLPSISIRTRGCSYGDGRGLTFAEDTNDAQARFFSRDIENLDAGDHQRPLDTIAVDVRPTVPPLRLDQSPSLYVKQEWAGRVTAIHEDEFDAYLHNLTSGGDEVATIGFEEISREDRDRMHVGSRLHWVMGYERSPTGTRSNVSRIVFLAPRHPTDQDMEAGRAWADRLRAKWGLD